MLLYCDFSDFQVNAQTVYITNALQQYCRLWLYS